MAQNAGLDNIEQPKQRPRSLDFTKFTGSFLVINNIDTDQVSGLSGEYNRKQHFIRARREGRFYENLVYSKHLGNPLLYIDRSDTLIP